MVKWRKIDKQRQDRRRRQESGKSPFIISKQAIIIGDERKCKPLSHYILLQSWQTGKQETIPKYAARKLETLKTWLKAHRK